MQTDTIKLIFTYALCALVIVGGGLMLYISRNEGNSDFALAIVGFIGAAISWLFASESATARSRSNEKAVEDAK